MDVIKVSAESRTSAVAGAVNQAVKACAIARTYLAQDGLDVVCIPSFVQVDIDGKERTALRLVVELR
ncbi:MAG: stage V sporulation protein S [Anaerolineales bacterium]|jgi:stage V sporulation protein S